MYFTGGLLLGNLGETGVCVCVTCVVQSGGRGIMLNCQNMEQSPEGTWVTSQPCPAALTANPAKLRPQEHT